MRALLVAVGVIAAVALAGSRVKEGVQAQGAVPATLADGGTTDGVAIADSEGCRTSARVADGGTINGGVLASWYYDGVLGWVRASTALDCTIESSKLLDGGAPSVQVCPDLGVLAKYGRVMYTNKSLVGADAGAISATVRVECWGRNIP